MKTVAFYTLGCKVNQYETEAMTELFKKAGYKINNFDDLSDVYIINTCSVTGMSDRKSRQIIRRAKKKNPESIIVVTGCYSQTAPEEVLAIEGVNAIIGTQNRKSIVNIVDELNLDSSKNYVLDIMHTKEFENLSITEYQSRTRAFLKIQDGCNQFCTYCIIPYARGPIRSRNEDDILEEIKKLSHNGFKEIILTGIHVASYGFDTGTSLSSLLMKIDEIDGIERVRLSSIEPMAINEDFIYSVKDSKKLCHHFHLSLQSGCDETLKRMNRKYTTDDFYKIVSNIRSHFPDVAITTDIMVGFPGETDEEFNKSLEFVKKVRFSDAHVFQYSKRRGTPAAKRKDQIDSKTKELRSKEMILATDKSRIEFIKALETKTLPVLFERGFNGIYEGKTDNYVPVFAHSDEDISGEILDVRLTDPKNTFIKGIMV